MWQMISLGFLLAVSLVHAPLAVAAAGDSPVFSRVESAVGTIRMRLIPELAAELTALQTESHAGLESVGAKQLVSDMRRQLVSMDETLAAISRGLRTEQLAIDELLRAIDRFSEEAVAFGAAMESLVGGEPRYETLRLEDEEARKRLLALAGMYRGFAEVVSELLTLLPDAIDARYREV